VFFPVVSSRGKTGNRSRQLQEPRTFEQRSEKCTPSINRYLPTTPYGKAGYTLDLKDQEVPLGAGAFFLFCFLCKRFHHLQQLAANEVGPGADLAGDALGARELLVHALSEELGGLWRRLVRICYDGI